MATSKSSRETHRERHGAPRRHYLCRGPSTPIQSGPQDKLKPRPTKMTALPCAVQIFPSASAPSHFTSRLNILRKTCRRCHPEPAVAGEGSAFRAHAKEKAESSGKLRPRNDSVSLLPQTVRPQPTRMFALPYVARISSSGATLTAQTRAARVLDATPTRALRDALLAEACWLCGSAEDGRRSRHPWLWWAA